MGNDDHKGNRYMEVRLYKLHFTTPVHFGNASADYDVSLTTIPSDSLYSALIACRAKYGKSLPNDKDGDFGFILSSTFPFYQENEKSNARLFFPKPLSLTLEDDNLDNRKKLKKIEWLEKESFKKAIVGEDLIDMPSKVRNNIHGRYFTDNGKIDKDFVYSEECPRVKVNKRNFDEDAEPFYIDKVYFKGYSGLFFLAQGDNKAFDILEESLLLLKMEGIGTDRNVGNGFFEFDVKNDVIDFTSELPFSENINSEYLLTLSSLIPCNKTIVEKLNPDDKISYYALHRNGGWISLPEHSKLRKNVIYSFAAGSVFANPKEKLSDIGKIADLKPSAITDEDFHVWRNGKSIFLPIKL